MGNRVSVSSVQKMLLQSHFIVLNEIKCKHFSNASRDSGVCIINCIREPVFQELDKIDVLVKTRTSFVDLPTKEVCALEQWFLTFTNPSNPYVVFQAFVEPHFCPI